MTTTTITPTVPGFIAWLESLPQDEPFCKDGNCPVWEYLEQIEGSRGKYSRFTMAWRWPGPFKGIPNAIDHYCSEKALNKALNGDWASGVAWANLTPREVLTVIRKVMTV